MAKDEYIGNLVALAATTAIPYLNKTIPEECETQRYLQPASEAD